MKSVDIHLMINNNPYIVPQKPLKQSKVTMQPVPLFPHQINRRSEDLEFKHHAQMMKRSTLPYFIEASIKEPPRIPLSPQTVIKGQHMQVSTVSPWENSREPPNSIQFRELSERINVICDRLDSQERRLTAMMEMKKHEQSTTLSDSTAHSYEPGNLFTSKQMEKYSQFEANCQNSTQIVQKLREEVNGFKFEREKYELNLKEHFDTELEEQRNAITAELISNFRESLNQKFAFEEQKINECIQELMKMEDTKIDNAIFQIKKELANQIYFLRQEFKSFEHRQKSNGLTLEMKQRTDRLQTSISELRADHLSFKDHVFKSILATHHQQEQMIKIKQKMQAALSLLQKRQVNLYEGYINISSQKSYGEIVKLSFQSYFTAANKHQSAKSKVNDCTYYIDYDGFLLDANGYYLLNSKNNRIKIEESEIRRLRQMGMLQ